MLEEIEVGIYHAINAALEKHFPTRIFYRDRIVSELAESWLAKYPDARDRLHLTWGSRDRDALELGGMDSLWAGINGIIGELELAFVHGNGEEPKTWMHPKVGRLMQAKDHDDSLGLEAMSSCVGIYLRSTWAESPMLEKWLTRQMIYAEAFAFGREVGLPVQMKSFRNWWDISKAVAKWLIGLAVAISVGEAYGAALGVLTYVAWGCLIQYSHSANQVIKDRLQFAKVFIAMQTTYRVALRSGAYPREIERHLALAEAEGAVWPEGLRPLLQRADSRGLTPWYSTD